MHNRRNHTELWRTASSTTKAFFIITLLTKREQCTLSIQRCTEINVIYRTICSFHNLRLIIIHLLLKRWLKVFLIEVNHLLFFNAIFRRLLKIISWLWLWFFKSTISSKEHLLIIAYFLFSLAISWVLSTSTCSFIVIKWIVHTIVDWIVLRIITVCSYTLIAIILYLWRKRTRFIIIIQHFHWCNLLFRVIFIQSQLNSLLILSFHFVFLL